jgi:hypothetical protein
MEFYGGAEIFISDARAIVLFIYHAIPWRLDVPCSAPHQNLAGKASTTHPAIIAPIIVNYIAIPHRFLATECTNIIVFMPPKRATPAPPPEPAWKSSRPATPTKKKLRDHLILLRKRDIVG